MISDQQRIAALELRVAELIEAMLTLAASGAQTSAALMHLSFLFVAMQTAMAENAEELPGEIAPQEARVH